MNSTGIKCPLCKNNGTRVLMGLFPVWLCEDEKCSTVWGFWSSIACTFVQFMYPPTNSDDYEGFAFISYTGNYFKAVWNLITGKIKS